MRNPPPGIRPATGNKINEDADLHDFGVEYNLSKRSPLPKSNDEIGKNVRSHSPRLPAPPPGVRSASMIQGTMSDEDMKKLKELQEKIDENNAALESKFINGEEEDPLEDPVERIHHELEAYNNSMAVEKSQVATAPEKYTENPLPPPPPETRFSRNAEDAYEPLAYRSSMIKHLYNKVRN